MPPLQPKQWRRVNNDKIKEEKYRLMNHLFNGDHAILNDFNLRNYHTIQDVIDMTIEKEEFFEKKAKKEQEMEDFKTKALSDGVIVNLKDATHDLFMDSDSMEEFWRVCYEIHKKQQLEVKI